MSFSWSFYFADKIVFFESFFFAADYKLEWAI